MADQFLFLLPDLIVNKLTETLNFLRDNLFEHADDAFSQFGNAVYQELADAIIAEYISGIIPSNPRELEEFQTVAQEIISFEGSLQDIGGFFKGFSVGQQENAEIFNN